uniref:Nucleic acid binding protein n=1 Tax=Sweet potato chlorotic fleck virus TaxID=263004 RepID=B7SL49_9VIRU|nr:nucleic acid binding protein [Sweet potato chlorotic fleck virus]
MGSASERPPNFVATFLYGRGLLCDWDCCLLISSIVSNYNKGMRTYKNFACGQSKSAVKRRARRMQICPKCAKYECGKRCEPNTYSQSQVRELITVGVNRYSTENITKKGTNVRRHCKNELEFIKYESLKVKPK